MNARTDTAAPVEQTPGERTKKSEKTRERVLTAAARVLREKGYAQTTLQEVAENAGLQAGSLYYHFDSKEQLAEAICIEGVDGAERSAEQAVAALPQSATPRDRLFAAIGAHLLHNLAADDFASATLRILHQLPDPVRKRALRRQRSYGAYLDGLFEAAEAAGEIRTGFHRSALRMLIFGAMNWSIEWYDPAGALSPEALRDELLELVAQGIAT